MEGVFVIKNVSVKLFFFNGGIICGCLWNSSASSMDGVFVIKNVSVKLFNFINGGSIGDQERVCQTLQFLQWREYWWSRTCLSKFQLLQRRDYLWPGTCLWNSSASSMDGVLVIKIASVKLFNFFSGGSVGDQERVCQNFSFINGGSIGDQERVCQTLQLLYWREYWWSRTCLSNSSASLMEGVLVIKNVSVKLFSFFNGGSIGDQERVCQTLQLLQRREYWWSRTCLSNSSVSSVEAVLVIKNVSVKLFSFINEGVLVMKNVSVKLFSFFSGGIIGDQERVCQNFSFINGGSIGDQERVCQTLQLLHWREYWWSRTCLSNSSASLMEGVLVIKNVSVKLFSFFNGGSIGDQERVCQTLQLHQWREYWWSRTCLSNSSASSMEGVLVIKNVSVKLFSFFNGGIICGQGRVCETLQLLQWRVYCIKIASVKLNFINGGSIGDEERVCQTLQLH